MTGAIGDELAALLGFRSTRLSADFLGASRVASGINSTSSVDSGVTVTLASGSFGAAVVPGRRFRVLSGPLAGQSALIDTVGGASLTLVGAGLGGSFSGASWEVLTEPETTAQVESTLGWQAASEVIIEGVRYRYTSKTDTTMVGMEWWDPESETWIAGAKQDHAAMVEVADYSKAFSALDLIRRGLSVATAEGEDLSILGRDRGVPRPNQLDSDAIYQNLLRAVMKAPKGTQLTLEAALEALFPGAWVLHEDTADHPAKAFLHRTGLEDTLEGKALLDGPETVFPSTTTSITVADTPREVVGVQYADEGGDRLIDEETEDASTVDGIVIAGTFPGQILPEDWFEVTDGARAGERHRVKTKDSGVQITLDGLGFGAAISVPFSWRIVREATHCGHAKPSAESIIEYPGDSGTSTWAFVGTSEAADATLATATYGPHMVMTDPGAGDVTSYEHAMRIEPESSWRFSAQVAIPSAATVDQGASSGLQFALVVHDGAQAFGVGFIEDAGGTLVGVGLVHATGGSAGQWAGSGPAALIAKDAFQDLEIRRDPESDGIRLLLGGAVIEQVAASVFGASSDRKVVFGCLSTTLSGMQALVQRVEYGASTGRDFWNSRASDGATAIGSILNSASAPFVLVTDVDKVVVIKNFGASNPGGGNARGRWRIQAVNSTTQVNLQGVSEPGAVFDDLNPTRVTVEDAPFAFRYPDSLGHTLVVETGPNAGSHTITAVLDPVTGAPMTEDGWSNLAACSGSSFADDDSADWRVDPVFPADSALEIEFPSGSFVGGNLTLRQPLTVNPASDSPVVNVSYARWPSGDLFGVGEPTTRVGGDLDRFAFYLYGPFGAYEDLFWDLVAYGVVPIFDGLVVDDAGVHIVW